ncbi:MAG: hypothetical protein PHX61_01840 [Alphaproteobacteria bacterium]|nr:hypothetical protein [Alphaproteobacteria bacterium]
MGFFNRAKEAVKAFKDAGRIKNGENLAHEAQDVAHDAAQAAKSTTHTDIAEQTLQRAKDMGLRPDEYFDLAKMKSAKTAELAGKDPKKWEQVHEAEKKAQQEAHAARAAQEGATAEKAVKAETPAAQQVPMYPQTGLAGITTPIVHEISSAIKNFNPLSKKIIGALGLGYVLAIDVPFTEGTDPLIKTGYQNINKMTNGQWDAEWQRDNALAKQADQLTRANQGAILSAQNAGASFINGGNNAPSVDQLGSQFDSLIKSQLSEKPEVIEGYTTRFKSILATQIDQNKDSMLQPRESAGLASSQSFADLMNDLPMKDEQKAYVANSILSMSGLGK